MGDENPICTLRDYSKPSHKGYRNTIELSVGNNVVPLQSDTIRLVQNGFSFHGLWSEDPNQHLKDLLKLVDSLKLDGVNRERTRLRLFQFSLRGQASNWLERLPAGFITTCWNEPRDFAKPVKAIDLPQDVPSTSDRHLIELENQVQRSMKAHLTLTQPTQVNKITTSCEICSGPYDTQYYMEDPEQAFVEYASSRTDEAGGKWYTFKPEQNNLGDTYNPSWRSHPNLRMKILSKRNPEAGEQEVEYFDIFPTRSELAYHKMYNWIMRRKLDPRENANGRVSNFTGRIKGMHVFIGNFAYIVDFMIIGDISSIIDPRLSRVVLGKPFMEISKMTHDPQEGVVRFTNRNNEVTYKMPHKIEQYDSLSNLDKEDTKSVYLRNE
ncbi:hypothetical protein Tco_1091868 [Tanacetum coccineum]|uniref:MAK10-like protein n=1 Tax=Tanacetum coccineum TaxID=301880 RepID=A0ABQ5I896_9ASTR